MISKIPSTPPGSCSDPDLGAKTHNPGLFFLLFRNILIIILNTSIYFLGISQDFLSLWAMISKIPSTPPGSCSDPDLGAKTHNPGLFFLLFRNILIIILNTSIYFLGTSQDFLSLWAMISKISSTPPGSCSDPDLGAKSHNPGLFFYCLEIFQTWTNLPYMSPAQF
jgi:hypothetical protein